jgi:osmotically-inducible protein OsmY
MLDGIAKNSAEKDLVGRLVSEVKGVRKVDNNMVVDNSNP